MMAIYKITSMINSFTYAFKINVSILFDKAIYKMGILLTRGQHLKYLYNLLSIGLSHGQMSSDTTIINGNILTILI